MSQKTLRKMNNSGQRVTSFSPATPNKGDRSVAQNTSRKMTSSGLASVRASGRCPGKLSVRKIML